VAQVELLALVALQAYLVEQVEPPALVALVALQAYQVEQVVLLALVA
jgi:hypothetical protein